MLYFSAEKRTRKRDGEKERERLACMHACSSSSMRKFLAVVRHRTQNTTLYYPTPISFFSFSQANL